MTAEPRRHRFVIEGREENIVSDTSLELLVERTLRQLRISGKLKGYHILAYALVETVKDPQRTALITKDFYPQAARYFGSTRGGVERAVRTAIQAGWDLGCGETLDQMVGYHLTKRPSNSEFIDAVAFYIRTEQITR